jgi:hypothetical protein
MPALNRMFAGMPVIGAWGDDSQDNAQAALQEGADYYRNLGVPDFKQYIPENYQWQGDYTPEMAQAKTVDEDPMLKSAQMGALSKMAGLANSGLSDEDRLGYLQAQQVGQNLGQSRTASALQNAQARGISGSGVELAMRASGDQAAQQAAQQAAMQTASDASKNRAMYNQAYLQGVGNVRNQDYGVNSGNADILNKFNQYNTGNKNQAQQYNLGGKQNIANQNVSGRNEAQQYNNTLAQQKYNAALGKGSGLTGALGGVAKGYAAENQANANERASNTELLGKAYGMG